jgi:hypothetical protein
MLSNLSRKDQMTFLQEMSGISTLAQLCEYKSNSGILNSTAIPKSPIADTQSLEASKLVCQQLEWSLPHTCKFKWTVFQGFLNHF